MSIYPYYWLTIFSYIGIISSIAFCPAHSGLLATGSYSQTTAICREDNMELLYVLHGQQGGVTHVSSGSQYLFAKNPCFGHQTNTLRILFLFQVMFSKDGNYLYTGGRKDPYILCWDIRKAAEVVYKLYRSTEDTNQRILFDIEPLGRHLGTGGQVLFFVLNPLVWYTVKNSFKGSYC